MVLKYFTLSVKIARGRGQEVQFLSLAVFPKYCIVFDLS